MYNQCVRQFWPYRFRSSQHRVSAKVNVLGENRQIKRTLALTLVLKQVYDWDVYLSSVKLRPKQDFRAIPKHFTPCRPKHYEHHIEPRIISLRDSEFQRYLRGEL